MPKQESCQLTLYILVGMILALVEKTYPQPYPQPPTLVYASKTAQIALSTGLSTGYQHDIYTVVLP